MTDDPKAMMGAALLGAWEAGARGQPDPTLPKRLKLEGSRRAVAEHLSAMWDEGRRGREAVQFAISAVLNRKMVEGGR